MSVCLVVLGAWMLAASGSVAGLDAPAHALDDGENAGGAGERTHEVRSISAMSAQQEGPNLLTNPDCNSDDGSGTPPDGWTAVSSNVQCTDPSTIDDLTSPDGSDSFADFSGDDSDGIVEQEVDVTGETEYNVGGEAGRDTGTSDYVEIEVEYRDSSGSVLSGSGTTVESKPAGGTYESFEGTTEAPQDAATAVVRVTLVDIDDTSYSDAYLNEVEFREVTSGVTAFPVSGVETGVEQTLDPSWTLFDDDYAEDEDDLGSEPADLASFGGGDLAGDATEYDAGDTADLAGGTLEVNADGSFSLTDPTETGTYAFDYRIETDDGQSDEATVTIEVGDHELENPACEETDGTEVPPGWTGTQGDMTCLDLDTTDDTDHSAAVGDSAFAVSAGTGDVVAEQEVWVVPDEEYSIEGLVGTDPGDDYGEVEVEYLDEGGNVISGEGVTVSNLQSDSASEFDRFADSSVAPTDAHKAVVRLRMAHVENDDFAGVYFDDLAFTPGTAADEPVNAYDVDGLEVGIEKTLAPDESVFDLGDQSDERGFPKADLASFGGGDLAGDVTSNDAGDTADLAGGTLEVNADGSFSLTDPTETGTYAFDYRIENEDASDDATVEIRVRDHTLDDPSCEDGADGWTDASPGESTMGCLDPSTDGDQSAPSGTEAFGDTTGSGDYASLEQTVPIRSGRSYEVGGFVGTDDDLSTADYGQVEVEYLDESGSVVSGAGTSLTDLRSDSDTEFDEFGDTSAAPENAVDAVVRITAHQEDGSYAEVYFDDLSFEELGIAPTANDADGFAVGYGGTLGESVVEDHGNGADDLGDPEASVASFGGGDLAGDATEYDAGDTADFAGGSLTLAADGSLELAGPTEDGTYEVDYRLENDAGHDDATVTIDVRRPNVDGTVTDAATGDPLDGATVTLETDDGTVADTQTSGDGSYAFDAVEGNTDYDVTVERDGYESDTDSVTVGSDDETLDVGLDGSASVSGTISDTTFETGVPGISVSVENSDATYTAETSKDGTYSVSVPGTDEAYTVGVSPEGWGANSATTATLGDGDDATDFDLDITGDAKEEAMSVSDAVTDEPIEDATVTVESNVFGVAEDVSATDQNGFVETSVPGGYTYDFVYSAAGYDDFEHTSSLDPGETNSRSWKLTGNAEISGRIIDADSGAGVEGATVTAEIGGDEYTATTDADGSYTVDGVPGGDDYDVSVEADGYDATTFADERVSDGATHGLDADLTGTATISGTVTDEVFGTELEDVTVTAEGDAGTYTVETDENGEYTLTVAGLADPQAESYDVGVETTGWESDSDTVGVGDGEDATGTDFELSGDASDDLTLTDAESGGEIADAEVSVESDSFGVALDSYSADSSGTVSIPALPGGHAYDYVIEADGYDGSDLADVSLSPGETASRTHTLSGNATLAGTVTDDVLGAPVEGLAVTAEHGGDTYDATTDADGDYRFEAVAGGHEYDVAIDEDGYELAETRVTVGDGASATESVVVSGNAELTGTVTDAVTGDEIDGATVSVEDGSRTYTATTDADGEYVVENIPGTGTDYDLSATIADYETNATVVSLGDGEDETADLALEGEPGSVSGTVTELDGQTPVENATVTLSNASETLDSMTTDDDGDYRFETVAHGDDYALAANATEFIEDETTGVTVGPAASVTGTDFALERDAFVAMTNLDAPDTAKRGDNVTLNATVENVGDVSETARIEYRIDDASEANTTVSLDAGDERYVEFVSKVAENATYGTYEHGVFSPDDSETANVTVRRPNSGSPAEPASLSVVEFSADPTEVTVGESVTVTATVENTGDQTGGAEFELFLDGDRIDRRTPMVAGGTTETMTFTAEPEKPGTHTLELDGRTLEIDVLEEREDERDGDESEDDGDGSDGNEDDTTQTTESRETTENNETHERGETNETRETSQNDGGDGNATGSDSDDDLSDEPTNGTVPGFDAGVTLVGLAVAVMAFARRE
ncbi:carboxypeptidase regulatory-like domain-containing protein [Halorussus amylolyticus]|uniref:carboxypeptidase regulatory-like domain-containing protein n=1 Tax=Halorussus amylolyticus TaxID=1126242 RepID=UPI00104B9204|nr:carboxypeptidase regulatory-like domain-containing protein [Halorussus amylolyticus]